MLLNPGNYAGHAFLNVDFDFLPGTKCKVFPRKYLEDLQRNPNAAAKP